MPDGHGFVRILVQVCVVVCAYASGFRSGWSEHVNMTEYVVVVGVVEGNSLPLDATELV